MQAKSNSLLKVAAGIVLIAMLAPASVWAASNNNSPAESATAQSSAAATLKRDNVPLSIENTYGLDFGSLLMSAFTGKASVTLDATGTISGDSNGSVTPSGGEQNAVFVVTGTAFEKLQVQEIHDITITTSSGGNGKDKMKIKKIEVSVSGTPLANNGTFTLPLDGEVELTVGGTLEVAGDNIAGVYSGTFDVTISGF